MKTILAVDDDKWILEVLRDALTLKGYQVVTAESGEEALRVLKERAVSLILLDLHLPGKNGFSVLHDINPSQETPVLFVSGCSRSFTPSTEGFTEVWTEHFANGMTDILYKPFRIEFLYEKVEALIGDSEVVENGPAL